MKVTHKQNKRGYSRNNDGRLSKRAKRRARQRPAMLRGNRSVVNNLPTGQKKVAANAPARQPWPFKNDICSFAWFNKKRSDAGIRAVKLDKIKVILDKPIPFDTHVEVAELLALVETLKFCEANAVDGKIYTINDVTTLLKSIDSIALSDADRNLVNEATLWLQTNKVSNEHGAWDLWWGDMAEFLDDFV